jgi:uracil permease
MIQTVDLNDNRNLFVVSSILVPGIGGLVIDFKVVQITSIATALIIGIIVNLLLRKGKSPAEEAAEEDAKYKVDENEKLF